jgi:hypothetical protein
MTIERADVPPTDSMGAQWQRAQAEMRSIGASIGDISDELKVLLVREGELAQAEVADATSAASRAAMWGGIGAVVGLIALLFVGMAVMFALGLVWPLWAAALATATLLAAIAALCALTAQKALQDFHIVPTRTIHSLKEDARWAREQIKRNAA